MAAPPATAWAIAAASLRPQIFASTRTLLTVHNVGYQGVFPASVVDEIGLGSWRHLLDPGDTQAGRFNFLRTGAVYADVLSTVSPSHAQEIQTDDYGMGLQDVLRARRRRLF